MGHLINAQDINTFCIHIFFKLCVQCDLVCMDMSDKWDEQVTR